MIRTCVVCGKKIEIKLGAGGKYDNGYYFGVIDVPVGKGEWKKIGTSKLLGGKHNVVKWTGKKKKVEYWECNKCFNEPDELPLREKPFKRISC
jgi:hypothetical protein